jgi:CRISPR-associated protein Cmr5
MAESKRTLMQKRAGYALDKITGVRDDNGQNKQLKAGYARFTKRLPAMVLHNGLGQAFAFLLADSGKDGGLDEKKPSFKVYRDIAEWLTGEEANIPSLRGIDTGGVLEALVNNGRSDYLRAQEEALALLDWMTMFADAFLPKEGS